MTHPQKKDSGRWGRRAIASYASPFPFLRFPNLPAALVVTRVIKRKQFMVLKSLSPITQDLSFLVILLYSPFLNICQPPPGRSKRDISYGTPWTKKRTGL